MKVSEFKKLEEGFFSDLAKVGSDAASFAKTQSGTPRVSKAELQRRYLQDFIEDLIVDLDAAIKGGRVNTSLQQQPATQQPAGTAQTQQPATQQPAGTAQTQQPQQAVQPTAATRQASLQRSAQRKAQRQPAKPVDREEELAGVADLGYNEGYHSFLNALVESYIIEQQQMPISEWIMMWFAAYMKGKNWENDKAGVEAIAKEIESTYKKDRGKAAIQKLASRSWDLFKTSGGAAPAGTKQPKDDNLGNDLEAAFSDQPTQPIQQAAQPDPEVENLKKALGSLSPSELATLRNELSKKVGTA